MLRRVGNELDLHMRRIQIYSTDLLQRARAVKRSRAIRTLVGLLGQRCVVGRGWGSSTVDSRGTRIKMLEPDTAATLFGTLIHGVEGGSKQ